MASLALVITIGAAASVDYVTEDGVSIYTDAADNAYLTETADPPAAGDYATESGNDSYVSESSDDYVPET